MLAPTQGQQITNAPPRPPPPAGASKSTAGSIPHTATSVAPSRPPPPAGASKSNTGSMPHAAESAAPSRPTPPEMTKKPSKPPSYEDAVSGKLPSVPPPPPYTKSSRTAPYLNVQAELDEIADENLDLPKYGSGSASQMKRSATSDSVGSTEQGEILFIMESVQVIPDVPSWISCHHAFHT